MYFLDARRQNISPAGRNNNAIEELLKSPQCLRPTLPFSDRKSANTDTRQQNYNLVTPRNAPLEMFHCHTDDRMNVNTTLTRYRLSPHPPAPSLPPDTCSHWTGVNTLVKRLSNVATRSLLHFHLIHVDTNTILPQISSVYTNLEQRHYFLPYTHDLRRSIRNHITTLLLQTLER